MRTIPYVLKKFIYLSSTSLHLLPLSSASLSVKGLSQLISAMNPSFSNDLLIMNLLFSYERSLTFRKITFFNSSSNIWKADLCVIFFPFDFLCLFFFYSSFLVLTVFYRRRVHIGNTCKVPNRTLLFDTYLLLF